MTKHLQRFAVGLGLALCAAQLLFASAFAQPQLGPIVVSSTGTTPLLVNGLAPDKLPVSAGLGSELCVPARQAYATEGERYIFQKWSNGSTDLCIAPNQPGEYRAIYSHEVLLVVKSDAVSAQRSMWAAYGAPVKLDVPTVVQENDSNRYRFVSWNDGETPFEASNTIAPVKPTTLQVTWAHEYLVTVDAPGGANVQGTGWYASGSSLVLRAPDTFAGDSDQQRYKFNHWENASFPAAVLQNPTQPLTPLKVDTAYTLRAVYDKQYLVDASSPFGALKHDWVNDGDNVIIEAPATSDILQDRERLVFKRWDGMGDGLISPKIIGKVDKPISATAVYEHQVMLTVNAPHGVSGDGWHKVGEVAVISVPSSVSEMFLLNATFVGFGGGYPAKQSTIQVLVNEPTTLTALYRTEPNLPVLVLVLFLPALAVLLYLSVTRGWLADLRARGQQRIRLFRARRKMKSLAWEHEQHNQELAAERPGRNGPHLPLPVGEDDPRT